MKKSIISVFILVSFTAYIYAKENTNIANDLKARYNDSTKICMGDKPAYQCSGIMIRGINQANNLPHAWSLKPENKQKESFSFAFLRHDQPFSSFPRGYDSGIIMYPQLKTPTNKNTYKVYCAFPIDGGTDGRTGHGCGIYNNDPMSNHCDKVGITTYNAWVNNFNRIMNSNDTNFVGRQCAFDMTISSRGKDFDIIRQANQYIQKNSTKYYMRNNELLVHAWNEDNAAPLPLEAFFYLIGSTDGLKHAQEFQKDYYNQTNKEIVPIVGIKLPKTPNDTLTVTYSKSDQIVSGGGGGGGSQSTESFKSGPFYKNTILSSILANAKTTVKKGDKLHIKISSNRNGKVWFYQSKPVDNPNYVVNSLSNSADGVSGSINITLLNGGKLADLIGGSLEYQFSDGSTTKAAYFNTEITVLK
ncbi:hypothetical protein DM558_04435 [Entomomonas moraniae]|uniref:Uncharacterized protein n=1 Tax=Entomomonas moraniae TaxID=2213226 RepID=A0A3S9XCD5_9GAMM|nr:hypothetical protein [Entomomonas moraniae]AZS50070.1 hypothetical protein DM558_04435 [Entomomonas moraniae]